MNIGSRPAKRKPNAGVESLRGARALRGARPVHRPTART